MESTVKHRDMPLIKTKGYPNSLSLVLQVGPKHFGDRGSARIKCLAKVGAKIYETEAKVSILPLVNQRYSSGDLLRSGGCIFCGDLMGMCFLILAFLTT